MNFNDKSVFEFYVSSSGHLKPIIFLQQLFQHKNTVNTSIQLEFCRKNHGKQTQKLQLHKIIHTGEKPYSRKYCYMKFTQISQAESY
jgi:hypothetical protein